VSHRNAPLTPTARLLRCQRIETGWAIANAADAMGISHQCPISGGATTRSSAPRTSVIAPADALSVDPAVS
jgi:hypothetical protein